MGRSQPLQASGDLVASLLASCEMRRKPIGGFCPGQRIWIFIKIPPIPALHGEETVQGQWWN